MAGQDGCYLSQRCIREEVAIADQFRYRLSQASKIRCLIESRSRRHCR